MKFVLGQKLKKLLSASIAAAVAAATMLGSLTAAASDSVNQEVKDAEAGVYAIELVYADKNSNKSFPIQSGTAFFINDDTLVTCNHVITMNDNLSAGVEAEAKNRYGSFSNSNLNVRVMLLSDNYVEASVITSSADADWAILQVKDKIKTTPLKIGYSDECENTQGVYAIGYPDAVANYASVKNFSKADITTTKGQISKISTGDVVEIQHGATVSPGNSGGPLVDEHGAVIGVNSKQSNQGDYYFATAMEQIVDILDQRQISYTRSNGSTGSTTEDSSSEEEIEPVTDSVVDPAPDPITDTNTDPEPTDNMTGSVDKSELDSIIKDCKKLDTSEYSKDSVKTFEAALDDAMEIADDEDATQKEVTKAINALDKAKDGLEKEEGLDTKMIVLIAAGAVVVILIIVIIIVALGGKKKPSPVSAAPVNPLGNNPYPAQQPMQQPAPRPQMSATDFRSAPPTSLAAAGETTVLSNNAAGAGETTVLSPVSTMHTLVRKKTGESIPVNKASYVIGKDNTADYCVTGNTSISRTHARLTVKGSQCFISDMRSTNGTFVNNARIAPNQETPLKSGDIVRLSDEEFEFRG